MKKDKIISKVNDLNKAIGDIDHAQTQSDEELIKTDGWKWEVNSVFDDHEHKMILFGKLKKAMRDSLAEVKLILEKNKSVAEIELFKSYMKNEGPE